MKKEKKEKFITEAYLDKTVEKFARVVKTGFDGVDKRFEQMDKRFFSLEIRMEEGFASLRTELSSVKMEIVEIHKCLDILDEKVERLAKAENEDIVALNSDISNLKARVFALEKQLQMRQT